MRTRSHFFFFFLQPPSFSLLSPSFFPSFRAYLCASRRAPRGNKELPEEQRDSFVLRQRATSPNGYNYNRADCLGQVNRFLAFFSTSRAQLIRGSSPGTLLVSARLKPARCVVAARNGRRQKNRENASSKSWIRFCRQSNRLISREIFHAETRASANSEFTSGMLRPPGTRGGIPFRSDEF